MAASLPLRNMRDIEAFEQTPFELRCTARSIYDVFDQTAQRFPEKIALTFISTGADDEVGVDVTYKELVTGIRKAANFFRKIGGPRPGVAFLLPSLIETHYVLWGAETAGYAIPINFLLTAEHIEELVRASKASILVALGPYPGLDIWQKASAVAAKMPDLKLVQVDFGSQVAPDAVRLADALREAEGDRLQFDDPGHDDQVAAYFHTGGTTGAPKLVTHTHRNQLVAAFGGAALLAYSERDTMTNGLPLFHVAGTIVCGLSLFMVGARIIMQSPVGMRNPAMVQSFWKTIEKYKVTLTGGIPTVMMALLNVPVNANLSSVRLSISGAAAAPPSVVRRFEEHTGFKVHEIFGMTETGGLIALTPAAAERVIGSVGLRMPYIRTEVRKLLADGKLGEVCAPGEVGVLIIHGPITTPGYRDDRHNDDAIREGFVNSGDLAYTDLDGRIFIAGRAKDLIIRGGHNIDPQLIEDVLQRHPAVQAAAAVGQPDAYAGELPVCYVALKPEAKASEDELRDFAQPMIAERPAWPKRYYFVDSIPVTAVGKIFKPELRRDAVLRLVQDVARAEGLENPHVEVTIGGPRGMAVELRIPAAKQHLQAPLEKKLGDYNFTSQVIADAEMGKVGT